jgi:hypothetical protein
LSLYARGLAAPESSRFSCQDFCPTATRGAEGAPVAVGGFAADPQRPRIRIKHPYEFSADRGLSLIGRRNNLLFRTADACFAGGAFPSGLA